MNNSPLTVLFLSTENAVRSQLAEALLRHKGGVRFIARSAGCKPAMAVDPATLGILSSAGISTDGLHTKSWREFFGAPSVFKVDVIVTLSEEARVNVPKWLGDPVRVHWPVDDPLTAANADVAEWKFRKCFATLENRITSFVKSRVAHSSFELMLQLKDVAMVGS